MKVIACTVKGPLLAWSDVDAWKIGNGVLTMWRGKVVEVVALPNEVIGLYDDAPNTRPTVVTKYEKREDTDGPSEAERDAPQRRYGRQRPGRPGR